jgi:hypothetical protein
MIDPLLELPLPSSGREPLKEPEEPPSDPGRPPEPEPIPSPGEPPLPRPGDPVPAWEIRPHSCKK